MKRAPLKASSTRLATCGTPGCTHLMLLDEKGEPFAEAVLSREHARALASDLGRAAATPVSQEQ